MASSNKVADTVGNLNDSFKKLTVGQQQQAQPNPKVKGSKAKKHNKAPSNPKFNMKSTMIVLNSSRTRKNGLGTSRTRDYFKTYSIFRCTKVECKRHTDGWKSVHGWDEGTEMCEFCNKRANLVHEADEPNCKVDMYVCGCGNLWDCLHDSFIDEVDCYACGELVRRSGTQNRHARHFWLKCINCKIEWETAKTGGRVFSQRCQACFNRGEKIGTYRETQEERDRRVSRSIFRVGTGTHDVDGCDMCQELIRQDVARSCTRSQHILVEEMENGESKLTDMTKRLPSSNTLNN